MTRLVLGPLLRYVDPVSATVWVQTDRPCTVRVVVGAADAETVGEARTFNVAGTYYALVPVIGLRPGTIAPYRVELDGTRVWPDPGLNLPPSLIRTPRPDSPLSVVLSSCRNSSPRAMSNEREYGVDAFESLTLRMSRTDPATWPDLLMSVGDQVYADMVSPVMEAFMHARRDLNKAPWRQVANFAEYTELYAEAWTDTEVRWLLSSLPSAFIFDDHDIIEDWNISRAWRDEALASGWWDERVIGGLIAYWVFQHLGNMSPSRLATAAVYREVRMHGDDDAEPFLRAFAREADREADGGPGFRWSFRREIGRTRLVALDVRGARVLADGHRSMTSPEGWRWLQESVTGRYDHLLLVSSMPWLLPRAIHEAERWSDVVTAGARFHLVRDPVERLRRAIDLEHWAAFGDSFDRLQSLLRDVADGRLAPDRTPPASVNVLSGDVHHSYVARAHWPEGDPAAPVRQLCSSPVHQAMSAELRATLRVGWSKPVGRLAAAVVPTLTGTPRTTLRWSSPTGPVFGNALITLRLDGREGSWRLERSVRSATGEPTLVRVGDGRIDDPAVGPRPERPRHGGHTWQPPAVGQAPLDDLDGGVVRQPGAPVATPDPAARPLGHGRLAKPPKPPKPAKPARGARRG